MQNEQQLDLLADAVLLDEDDNTLMWNETIKRVANFLNQGPRLTLPFAVSLPRVRAEFFCKQSKLASLSAMALKFLGRRCELSI